MKVHQKLFNQKTFVLKLNLKSRQKFTKVKEKQKTLIESYFEKKIFNPLSVDKNFFGKPWIIFNNL